MRYISTRNNRLSLQSKSAIVKGISDEGGLFVPETFPTLENPELFSSLSYREIAFQVLRPFLSDFSKEELIAAIDSAYDKKFDDPLIVPLVRTCSCYYMELYHGATCAFKDIALSILPLFMTAGISSLGIDKKVVILTATSGDTGKAALQGFMDVPGTAIVVYFPEEGVSPIQKLQMRTQKGSNTKVIGIRGNFDDCQRAVKEIFNDSPLVEDLSAEGCLLSSANSINIGRLLPQIVYYFSSYAALVRRGDIDYGDLINFVVPTGNFGDILAGYYAEQMGLPVHKLICASNENKVLTDFINTGVYDKNRELHLTNSPSMDILVSSNLERYLYHLSEGDDRLVAQLMEELQSKGVYHLPQALKEKMNMAAGFADEEAGNAMLKKVFEEEGYLMDTHTAVARAVYEEYRQRTQDSTPTVILSTASPYKFPRAVFSALGEELATEDDFAIIEALSELTDTTPPQSILDLRVSPVCHEETIDISHIKTHLEHYLKGDHPW